MAETWKEGLVECPSGVKLAYWYDEHGCVVFAKEKPGHSCADQDLYRQAMAIANGKECHTIDGGKLDDLTFLKAFASQALIPLEYKGTTCYIDFPRLAAFGMLAANRITVHHGVFKEIKQNVRIIKELTKYCHISFPVLVPGVKLLDPIAVFTHDGYLRVEPLQLPDGLLAKDPEAK